MVISDWLFRFFGYPKHVVDVPAADVISEIVRIGTSGARIVKINQGRIEYVDMSEQKQFIDLVKCAGIYGDELCVGTRGALDDPPWVQFANDRNTRFEFETYEAVYELLLGPLSDVGWRTFDTC